jgi:antitoxin ParD1/3/4
MLQQTQTIHLGDYWNQFIETQLQTGRYTSINEIVSDSLRLLEERQASFKLETLRNVLIAGEESGDAGELDMQQIKQQAKQAAGLI